MPTNKKKAHDDDEMRDDPNRDMDMDEEIEPGMQKKAQSPQTGASQPGGMKRSEGDPGRPSSTPRKRK